MKSNIFSLKIIWEKDTGEISTSEFSPREYFTVEFDGGKFSAGEFDKGESSARELFAGELSGHRFLYFLYLVVVFFSKIEHGFLCYSFNM